MLFAHTTCAIVKKKERLLSFLSFSSVFKDNLVLLQKHFSYVWIWLTEEFISTQQPKVTHSSRKWETLKWPIKHCEFGCVWGKIIHKPSTEKKSRQMKWQSTFGQNVQNMQSKSARSIDSTVEWISEGLRVNWSGEVVGDGVFVNPSWRLVWEGGRGGGMKREAKGNSAGVCVRPD